LRIKEVRLASGVKIDLWLMQCERVAYSLLRRESFPTLATLLENDVIATTQFLAPYSYTLPFNDHVGGAGKQDGHKTAVVCGRIQVSDPL
jgi:hypothetical protein